MGSGGLAVGRLAPGGRAGLAGAVAGACKPWLAAAARPGRSGSEARKARAHGHQGQDASVRQGQEARARRPRGLGRAAARRGRPVRSGKRRHGKAWKQGGGSKARQLGAGGRPWQKRRGVKVSSARKAGQSPARKPGLAGSSDMAQRQQGQRGQRATATSHASERPGSSGSKARKPWSEARALARQQPEREEGQGATARRQGGQGDREPGLSGNVARKRRPAAARRAPGERSALGCSLSAPWRCSALAARNDRTLRLRCRRTGRDGQRSSGATEEA